MQFQYMSFYEPAYSKNNQGRENFNIPSTKKQLLRYLKSVNLLVLVKCDDTFQLRSASQRMSVRIQLRRT
jgi:hypothetical protein